MMGVGGRIVDCIAAVLQLNQFLSSAWIFLAHVVGIVAGVTVSFRIVQSVSSRLFFLASAASNDGASS